MAEPAWGGVEVETRIAAPPERVWLLVSDVDLPGRFSDEFQGAEWLDDDVALGSRFVGTNRIGSTEWRTTGTVVELEPPTRFAWVVNDPQNPAASWGFVLERVEEDTRLRQWCTLGPGPSGLGQAIAEAPEDEARIVQRRKENLRANMRRTVEGIKQLAEAPEQ